ncbi:hypothetical protein I4U23_031291, partial [Adineta vaga]
MKTTFFVLLSAIAFLQIPTCSFATTSVKTAEVNAHMVVNKGENLRGTMVIANCDKDSLSQSKDSLSKTLTQKVQADDSKNSASKVSVTGVRDLGDGMLALDYECTAAKNPETAKTVLNTCVKQDDVKKTIQKSAVNVQTTQAKKQTTEQTKASTQKPSTTTTQAPKPTTTTTTTQAPKPTTTTTQAPKPTTTTTQAPKVTQKEAPRTTEKVVITTKQTAAPTTVKTTQGKTTKTGAPKKAPATKRTVQVKNCDDDDIEEKDQTLTGKIVVQDCPCEKRFTNNATRLAALSSTVCTQLRNYFQQLYSTKVNYPCSVKVLTGNKTHTVFSYTVNVPKAEQSKAKVALKKTCKDDEVKKTIEKESIKRDGDDDSDSSSSEEATGAPVKPVATQKATAAPTEKPTTAKPATAAPTTAKPATAAPTKAVTSKSGKTLKPSKPATVDCDKDHKVQSQDDNTVTGVIRVGGCHATRFARKPSRCGNVGGTLTNLLQGRLNKLGVKFTDKVQIVKTAGDKKATEFHYKLPCGKAQQKQVIDSLKDTCKDKDLHDTCTKENQPDEDDSSSSSESDEKKTTGAKATQKAATAAPATAAPTTAKAATAAPTKAVTSKSGKTLKPSKPATVDCDKDHKVQTQDDNTVTGVIRVGGCHATRFARKPSRCGNVGGTLTNLLQGRLNKLGVKFTDKVQIVKTAGDKKATEFHYKLPCGKAQQKQVIDSLKDTCKDKDLHDTCTKENQPDEDDSTTAAPATAAPTTAKPATAAPTQKPATAAPTKAVTSKSGKTLKPSKPATVDCDKDHKVQSQDDNTVTGVIRVGGCHATRFARKPSRCGNVGGTLTNLLQGRLNKLGVKFTDKVQIVKTAGDKKATEFHYKLPCGKAQQKQVIDSLKDTCKDKDLHDTCTKENQPDEDDSSSSSESDEKKTTGAKATQKAATAAATEKATTAKPTEKPTTAKTTVKTTTKKPTQAGVTKRPPATTRTVQVKNCDDDDIEEQDQTLTGKIVVQDCPCEKRFANNATRLAALSSTVCTQLRNYFQQLHGTKVNYPCSVKVLTGNKTHTVFSYTVNVPKAEQSKAKAALKKTCKDDEVKKTIEKESLKRDDDDDSDSSSSEETTRASGKPGNTAASTAKPATAAATTAKPATAAATTAKPATAAATTAKPATAAPTTAKPATAAPTKAVTSKSGKTLKPSKPATVDCDKDHKVQSQDDNTVTGVIRVGGCHATRFARKPSRCGNVGGTLTNLLQGRLNKLGVKFTDKVQIVKTAGDKKATEFHYKLPCGKAQQKQVIDSLKDTCKDKDLHDTCTKENQPDEDDSSSSSESDEKKTTGAKATQKAATAAPATAAPTTAKPATAAPTQKPATAAPTKAVTSKSGKTLKPSKPATVDCDKDHKVQSQDDNTVTGVIRVGGCHATRFARKPSRCGNVGGTLTNLLHGRLNKLGVKFTDKVQIVKTAGDKKATEFHYKLPCGKAQQKQVIDSLKDTCKDKDLHDTVTNENQPDEDDSSSSSESDEKKTTGAKATQKAATAAPATAAPTTAKPATAAPTKKVTSKSGKTLKPSKPATVDCDKDHKVQAQDDSTVTGVIRVGGCHATRFARKPSRCGNVGGTLTNLLHGRLNKLGVKFTDKVQIVKTAGDKKATEFHYKLPCGKAQQKQVIDSLKDTCKDKDLHDTVTNENQPDEDDSSSSSESDEKKTTGAKATQKAATAAPTQKPATQKPATAAPTKKVTSKSGKTLKPSKPATVDCDKDHKVQAQDDNTVTGVIRVGGCHATRFARKPSRCGNVGGTLTNLLHGRLNKLGVKFTDKVQIVKTAGDKKATEFHYKLPCGKAQQKQVIDSLKDTCKDKDLHDTVTNENQPDEDDSSSSSESDEKKTTGAKATQKAATAAPATAAATQKPATAAPTKKVTSKSGKTLKPSKPATVDCDKDHKVQAQDDSTVTGVIRVGGCHATRFARKPSRCGNVGGTLTNLLHGRLNKLGVKFTDKVQIVKTAGDKKATEFHYKLPCGKAQQKQVIDSLKDTCKDKDLHDTVTNENQPDEDDSSSSSESDEKKTTGAKATQKAATAAPATAAPTTAKPATAAPTKKVTSKSGKTLKPSKPATVDCDKDHKVQAQDDTVTGVIRVGGCHATRFARKPSRCGNVGGTLTNLLHGRLNKLGVKFTDKVQIVKTAGDKKQLNSTTNFHADKDLHDTVTNENQPDEDDSSSSSESDEKKTTGAKATQKAATAAPATAAPTTAKPATAAPTKAVTSKSGKTLKPSKPATVDCDKDHNVQAQDDNTVTGVIRVGGCHATRFARKPSRCGNVGGTLTNLLHGRLNKLGVKFTDKVQIVKTAGDKKATEFHYKLPCGKAQQKQVIDSLKDTCKDKDLHDTVTNENQPDEDDSSSSSESDEKKTTAKPATAAPTKKVTSKSGKTLKPSKPATVDCDKDHKVQAQDDNTVTGVIRVGGCHATRFARKPSRCGNVGGTLTNLLHGRLNKLGVKFTDKVQIVKTAGDKKATEFHYKLPCGKAQQKQVIDSLKDTCKDKDLHDTVTNENQPDEDDSSSSSESDEKKTTGAKASQKPASAAPTQKPASAAPTQKPASAAPTQKPATAAPTKKVTSKSGKTLKPSKPATVDCDKDHKVQAQDENTVTGVIRVGGCHATRFARKPSRCGNVGGTLTNLLHGRLNKLGVKFTDKVQIVKTAGDKKATEFHYKLPCGKAQQKQVIDSLKDTCKDKDLHDTVTNENQPDEDDSSSSSESDEKKTTGAKASQKPASAAPTQKPASAAPTKKVTSKSGKTLKPSKPATVDCDKDHKVQAQDENTVTGVIRVGGCHATRFARKPSRCGNVGGTLTNLLHGRLNKLGVKFTDKVQIVKTAGDKKATEFHYKLPCGKAQQKQVIDSLKDTCKDKDLHDTVTNENQPDEDDSSSSSESDEKKTTGAKASQKPVTTTAAQPSKATAAPHGTTKSGQPTKGGKASSESDEKKSSKQPKPAGTTKAAEPSKATGAPQGTTKAAQPSKATAAPHGTTKSGQPTKGGKASSESDEKKSSKQPKPAGTTKAAEPSKATGAPQGTTKAAQPSKATAAPHGTTKSGQPTKGGKASSESDEKKSSKQPKPAGTTKAAEPSKATGAPHGTTKSGQPTKGGKASSESDEKKSSKQPKPAGTTKAAEPSKATGAPQGTTKAAQPSKATAAPHGTTKSGQPTKGGKASSESDENKSSKQPKPAGTTKAGQPSKATGAPQGTTKAAQPSKATAAPHGTTKSGQPTKGGKASSESDEKKSSKQPKPAGTTKAAEPSKATGAPQGTTKAAQPSKATAAPHGTTKSGQPTKGGKASSESDEKKSSKQPKPAGTTKAAEPSKATGAPQGTTKAAQPSKATAAPHGTTKSGQPTKGGKAASESDEKKSSKQPKPAGTTKAAEPSKATGAPQGTTKAAQPSKATAAPHGTTKSGQPTKGGKASSESDENKSSKQPKPAGTTKAGQPSKATGAPQGTTKAAQPSKATAAPHGTTKSGQPTKGGKASSESDEKKSSKQPKPAGTTKAAEPSKATGAPHGTTKSGQPTKGGKASSESDEKKSSKQPKPAGTTKAAEPSKATGAPQGTTKAAQPSKATAAPHGTTKSGQPTKGGKASSESDEKKSSKQPKPAGTTKAAEPSKATGAPQGTTKAAQPSKATAAPHGTTKSGQPTKGGKASSESDEKKSSKQPKPAGTTKSAEPSKATGAPQGTTKAAHPSKATAAPHGTTKLPKQSKRPDGSSCSDSDSDENNQ